MKKILFTLNDSNGKCYRIDTDLQLHLKEGYELVDETAIALYVNKNMPEIQKCKRRIQKLQIVDECGGIIAELDDFDIYCSLKYTKQ
ncbi:MAG: hypothetical protein IKZ61_05770 [Prevotella sp.]|nr:hypothetical protein [Prevotella sp.]